MKSTIKQSMPLAMFGLVGLVSSPAMASDCFVLVHGHGADGTVGDNARSYWENSSFEDRTPGDLVGELTGDTDNYGFVGWNSTDEAALPYWHHEAAGSIAQQVLSIANGEGDGLSHERQCEAGDRVFVVAHSQGAQVMAYISGNGYAGSLLQDTTFGELDTTATSTAVSRRHCDGLVFRTCWYEQEDVHGAAEGLGDDARTAPFTELMSRVASIFSIGGAVNGTEGADRLCAGGWEAWLGDQMGRDCSKVPSLQTHRIYNPDAYTGATLETPIFHLGGYRGFDGVAFATSGLLNGEDDGYINLASQMNCQGSAKRSIDANLKAGWFAAGPNFTCDEDHKRHFNSVNMASIKEDHDSERNAALASPSRTESSAIPLTCGAGRNMVGTIRVCLGGQEEG